MNYVHNDNIGEGFPPVNLDNVKKIKVDEDNDIKFSMKGGESVYWEYKDAKKSWEMIQKILDHLNSTNLDSAVKFE